MCECVCTYDQSHEFKLLQFCFSHSQYILVTPLIQDILQNFEFPTVEQQPQAPFIRRAVPRLCIGVLVPGSERCKAVEDVAWREKDARSSSRWGAQGTENFCCRHEKWRGEVRLKPGPRDLVRYRFQ